MKCRAIVAWWFAAAVALGAMASSSTAAYAAAPKNQGWWSATNPVPAPPDVPAQGLLVQAGGGGAPTAYAALLYELGSDTASTLTLAVAPNSATTSASLELCPLIQPIVHPDQGGPMSDAPGFTCAKHVTAAPADGGYKFDVSGLAADKVLAVAILPTGPVDRVVLSAPDANSLATQPGPADITTANPGELADSPSGSAATRPSYGGSDAPLDVPLPVVATSPAAAGAPAASTPPADTSNEPAPFIPAVTAGRAGATPLLVVLLIVLGMAGAALWLRAGRARIEESTP